MTRRGKKYNKSADLLDSVKMYDFHEAMNIVISASFAKFDETIDVAVRLGVDPRHADQMVRGAVVLPNGLGKDVKVLVFSKNEKEIEARESGADFVGGDEMIAKIVDGWFGFDRVVATPDMMSSVGKIGRLLGPRGLMPNVKTGTVTFDVAKAVREIKSGKIDFKVEKAGIVHVAVGKVSFGLEKLLENLCSFLDSVMKLKPVSSKGTYVKGITVSSTMGPGVKIDTSKVSEFIK